MSTPSNKPEKIIRKRVRKACLHCKRAKTSCSESRPCNRCVRLHLSDTCIDPPTSSSSIEGKFIISSTPSYKISGIYYFFSII